MEQLEIFFKKFQDQQNAILDALIVLDHIEDFSVDSDINTSVERFYHDTFIIAARILPTKTVFTSALDASRTSASVLSLPKIELPKFDGNLTQWRSIRDKFISLIRRNVNLSQLDQFYYLLSCLSGPALSVIISLTPTENNYHIAWSTLSSHYDNQLLLTTAHLEKLFAFRPMTMDSLLALLTFVNTFQENIAAIKVLGVVDLSDFIMFFIGSRLLDLSPDNCSKRVSHKKRFRPLTLFSCSYTNVVTYLKILVSEKIDMCSQRTKPVSNSRSALTITQSNKSIASKSSHPRQTVNLVDNSIISCAYYKNTHAIYRRHKFSRLPVSKRRDFILSQRLCFSCMSSSHMASDCPIVRRAINDITLCFISTMSIRILHLVRPRVRSVLLINPIP